MLAQVSKGGMSFESGGSEVTLMRCYLPAFAVGNATL